MITTIDIAGKKFAIKGVGKLFYQHGYPISQSIVELRKKNIYVSVLHVADECLKNGWSPQTVTQKFIEDFADSSEEKLDQVKLLAFCNATYEDQREIIRKSLFDNNRELFLKSLFMDLSSKNNNK